MYLKKHFSLIFIGLIISSQSLHAMHPQNLPEILITPPTSPSESPIQSPMESPREGYLTPEETTLTPRKRQLMDKNSIHKVCALLDWKQKILEIEKSIALFLRTYKPFFLAAQFICKETDNIKKQEIIKLNPVYKKLVKKWNSPKKPIKKIFFELKFEMTNSLEDKLKKIETIMHDLKDLQKIIEVCHKTFIWIVNNDEPFKMFFKKNLKNKKRKTPDCIRSLFGPQRTVYIQAKNHAQKETEKNKKLWEKINQKIKKLQEAKGDLTKIYEKAHSLN